MNRYDFHVRLTAQARRSLRPDEALILDWHRMAICGWRFAALALER
jgi:hypothetical protein